MTDSEARQVAEKTLIADDSASPEHFSLIFPATCGSRTPQRLLRSDGLDWTLCGVRPVPLYTDRMIAYPSAAIKQAGGVASATRTRAKMAMEKIEEYMLIELNGYLNADRG